MRDECDRKPPAALDLRKMTQARVRLGRFGAGLPTRATQTFLLDHARARQAVWSQVDWLSVGTDLADLGLGIVEVESQAPDRASYVRRPDLGRKLSSRAAERLAAIRSNHDILIVIADGLSASAIDTNARPLTRAVVERLSARRLSIAPVVLASQARVALADPIAEIVGARISIVIIGERPGLSAADSVGVYVTYSPRPGTPDSRRNCISNVRRGGLAVDSAADGVESLIAAMLRTGVSGVGLKDAAAEILRIP